MAVACGLAVANLYYAQPLLGSIAQALGTSEGATGWVVTAAQGGYAAGLLLLVPAGDIINRRRLVLRVLMLTPLALLAAGFASSIGLLIAASLLVGVTSVVPQVLVPFAASLASEEERGKVVGTVISGLLIGILCARTVSGLLAEVVSWRGVFYVAAGVMVFLALLLSRELPDDAEKPRMGYGELIRSVGRLLLDSPVLRLRSIYGALGFAAFSVFWTTVAFVLAGPPYHYSHAVIGLFGLIGAAGAGTASLVGRLADKGGNRMATGIFAVGMPLSFLILWFGSGHIIPMVLGVIVLDIALQGVHVLNQSEMYKAVPDAGSRANSAYMTAYMLGGALGSAAGAYVWGTFGWTGVCFLGGGISMLIVILWALDSWRARAAA